MAHGSWHRPKEDGVAAVAGLVCAAVAHVAEIIDLVVVDILVGLR
jgi:hypothetical protein